MWVSIIHGLHLVHPELKLCATKQSPPFTLFPEPSESPPYTIYKSDDFIYVHQLYIIEVQSHSVCPSVSDPVCLA